MSMDKQIKAKKETMSLKELYDALGQALADGCSPEAGVSTEGCDCFGEIGSVSYDEGSVCLDRPGPGQAL